MPQPVQFILGFHSHQPVGNFEHVFEEGYQKAYAPLVDTFLQHPKIKVTWHFTGYLYDWINTHHPELNKKIKLMVSRGQSEIMTGGYYEPILSVIPEHDRLGQIQKLTDYIKQKTQYNPTGAWLAERVWEPQLAGSLVDAGIQYTVTDDSHFLSAGLTEEETWGYYLTEELGKTLAIFPINQRMRYLIPFQEPEETIRYLKRAAEKPGNHIVVMADDGEKFGIWPGTHEHCYVNRWLNRFLEELEKNLDWIKISTFSECLQSTPPKGRIYLPTASYTEMMEWAMPATAIIQYEHLVEDLKNQGEYEQNKHFIRGGFWRNFLVKYPESNNIHKKMLHVSEKVQNAINQNPHNSQTRSVLLQAQDALWAGQTNCAYWHGVFGGLYLNYLRDALYRKLIQAEQLVDKVEHGSKSWVNITQSDFDADGSPEILVNTTAFNAYFKPSYGGALFELDIKSINFNLLDTLSRKKEAYHEKLVHAQLPVGDSTLRDSQAESQETGTKTIHDLVLMKEPHLEQYLHYDWYLRYSFLDHFLPVETSLTEFSRCKYTELGDFVNQPYQSEIRNPKSEIRNGSYKQKNEVVVQLSRSGFVWYEGNQEPIQVTKTIRVPKDSNSMSAEYTIKNLSLKEITIKFGIELNFALLAGNAPDRYYYFPKKTIEDKKLASTGIVEKVTELGLVDEWQKLDINLKLNKPATVWRFPIETVSQSEAGFERVYQSSVVVPNWVLHLAPKQIWQMQIQKRIKT